MIIIERIKNIALVRVYPLSLFFLTFCGPKDKEHKIPYEQMPLIVRADASEEKKTWIASYNTNYGPHHLAQIVEQDLNTELNAPKDSSQATLVNENKDKTLAPGQSSQKLNLNKLFRKKLKYSSLASLKESLEAYILSDLEKSGDPLKYSSQSTSLLDPVTSKTANAVTYTKLMQTLLAASFERPYLRDLRVVVIFSPGSRTLGYTIKDSEQGWLLMGLPSTALGSKVKYYGPTSQLSGPLAIIDLELAVILDSVKDSISNLDAARNFALDHSAKRHHYKTAQLSPNFKKDNASSAFEIASTTQTPALGSEEVLLEDGTPYPESAITYMTESTELDNDTLQSSYKRHIDNLARQEDIRRQEEERARLGADYKNIGPWPHKFGGIEKMQRFIQTLTLNTSEAPSFVLDQLPRERECWTENPLSNKDFLISWGISGENRAWKFQKIKDDDLGACRTSRDLGNDMGSKFLIAHTIVLQPLYVGFPKTVSQGAAREGVTLFEKQKTLSEEIATKFCAELRMKSIHSASSESAELLKNISQELFHSDVVTPENTFEKFADHNFFSIRCYNLGQKVVTTPTSDPEEPRKRTTKKRTYTPGVNPAPAPQRSNFNSPSSRVR